MKYKGKIFSIALASAFSVFVFLFLLSAAASAAQITKIGNGYDPAVYGNTVVWTNGGVIHVYDVTSRTDTTISSSAASHPAIYENKVVWHDESSGTPKLAVYDIASGNRSYISENVDDSSIPAIYGNRIVWSANYNDSSYNYNVYMRDISTSTQTKISEGNNPDIYETKITYGYEDDYGRNIVVYDINTKETINAHHSSQVFNPYIYGNKVIWSDFYTRMGYIQMYDLVTEKTVDVTSDNTGNTLPEYANSYADAGDDTGTHAEINGNIIVYSKAADDQFGYAGVYVYDIPTGQSIQLYNYPKEVYTTPEVYENIVVWGFDTSYGPGTSDTGIYLCDLAAQPTKPEATFTANITSGTAPLTVLFTNIGDGGTPTAWNWSFGDGINSKHVETATHTFTNPGNYTVNLTVSNDAGSDTAIKEGYIIVTGEESAAKPVADFYSPEVEEAMNWSKDYIFENDVISFYDKSTGTPTSWFWDFGDGNTSTEKNPTHVYGRIGGFIVNLTVSNAAGSDTISKYGYVLIETSYAGATPPHFSADVTSGDAPLTVTFHDTDEDGISGVGPIWREWNFGDGNVVNYWVDANESATPYAMHVYEKPGKYSVTLRMDDRGGISLITKHNYITVTDPDILIADFSNNVSEGYVPLTVQFNDSSQNATSRVWDFNNDGQVDSDDMNPVYTYTVPGTYIVNLTVSNENGTVSKTETITVKKKSSSSGGSKHSSGGGAGGSPEPAKNVKSKELCQVFITSGKAVKFDFAKNATSIVALNFDSKKTVGKTTTIVEMLKNKSTLTKETPEGEVYNYLNIWVGNGGYGSDEDNLENAVINFKVEKAWVQDKGIDKSSITINRYNDNKWNALPTTFLSEDDKYLYFKAETPGFSPFAITGDSTEKQTNVEIQSETENKEEGDGCAAGNVEQQPETKENTNTSQKDTSTPGFEMIYGVVCLLGIFLYRRQKI